MYPLNMLEEVTDGGEDTSVMELETSSLGSTESTSTTPEEEGDDKSWFLPVVLSVSIVVAVALVTLIAVFTYRRWGCFGLLKRDFKLARPIQKVSISSGISSVMSSVGKSELKKSKAYVVKLSELEEQIGRLGEDTNRGFAVEFQTLKEQCSNRVHTTHASLQSQNVLKNRFSNILAYDNTRFELKTEEEGESNNDYINANYVSGYRFKNEFIATQGPLQGTVNDFWRMCWESKCQAIVMLTKCYEKGQEKCYPYWPTELGSRTCGDIKITLEKQTPFRIQSHLWLLSELQLEKGEESRPLLHFVFLSWPDFGVVDPPQALISFVKEFRKRVPYPAEAQSVLPIVMHCSAGVGRSGVFIAIDYILQQLQAAQQANEDMNSNGPTGSINIFQIVARMRKDRMGMVQTLPQYILIYKALLEMVNGGRSGEVVPSTVSSEPVRTSDWGLVSSEPAPATPTANTNSLRRQKMKDCLKITDH